MQSENLFIFTNLYRTGDWDVMQVGRVHPKANKICENYADYLEKFLFESSDPISYLALLYILFQHQNPDS